MRNYKLWLIYPFWVILSSHAQQKDSILLVGDSITIALSEVFVKAERPLIKVSDHALTYDIPAFIKSKPVNTAFDVLSELPGIMQTGDKITIIGAPSTTIIFNGRKSSMTESQIIQYLKSLSATKISGLEVMYSTPPRYGVKGASINITTEKESQKTQAIQADISLTGREAHYFSPSGIFNLTYAAKKRILDFSYSIDCKKTWSREEMDAYPIVENIDYKIEQVIKDVGKPIIHTIKVGFSQELKNKNYINIAYTGSINNSKTTRESNMDFVTIQNSTTYNLLKSPSQMHNFRIDYRVSDFLSFGTDYTFYKVKNDQNLQNDYSQANTAFINAVSRQKINRGNLYISYSYPLKNLFKFNCGANATFSGATNSSYTYLDEIENEQATFSQQENEYEIGGYVGLSKKFGSKLSIDISLNLNYSHAESDSMARTHTLWSDVNLFPQFTLTWHVRKANILQLSFSSDRKYPAYWALNPSISYLNAYSVVTGNPYLKPEKIYSARMNYIIKQKYMFGLFVNHQADYIQ